MDKIDLNTERLISKQKEMKDATFFYQIMQTERERFEYADKSQWLLQEKNDSDILLITESLVEWLSNSKNQAQKDKLNSLLMAAMRIDSYSTVLETICKQSVSKLVGVEKELEDLKYKLKRESLLHISEMNTLKSKIVAMEREIEFLNK